MVKRIGIAAILLPFFVWAMLYGPAVYFQLFMAVCIVVGYFEYRYLMLQKDLGFSLWPGLMALFVLLMPAVLKEVTPPVRALEPGGALAVLQGLAIFFIALGCMSVSKADLNKGLLRFFAEFCGPLYLGVLGLHMILLHQLKMGGWWVFSSFWYAWIYDAGGLFIGKPFGKHRLSELSPAKTWEGFIGGTLITALLAWFLLPVFLPKEFPLKGPGLALLAIPASILAQAGDLFESMLKRFAGVKDSSSLISAHGGFLDKLDSSLFVAPALYVVAVLLGAR
jgi:phosphatidate cytidylyltransferase